MTAIGNSGWPSARAWARASPVNEVEHTASAARPRFATSTLSWTLHDVQDPQSPDPVMTRSHSLASSATNASGAGMDAPRFARLITVLTP